MQYRTYLILSAAVAFASAPLTQAAVFTFDGSTSSDMELGTNYAGDPATPPASDLLTDQITFDAAATNQATLTVSRQINGITLSGPGVTLGGAPSVLSVGAGGITSTGSGTNLISASLNLQGAQNVAVGDGNTLSISGGTLAGTATTVTKTGAGNLILGATLVTGAGTSTPKTYNVADGTLTVGSANPFNNKEIQVNGTLDLNNSNIAAGTLLGGTGTITNTGIDPVANTTVVCTVSFNQGGGRTFAGVITGAVAVTKVGNASLTFSGTTNSYTGTTTIGAASGSGGGFFNVTGTHAGGDNYVVNGANTGTAPNNGTAPGTTLGGSGTIVLKDSTRTITLQSGNGTNAATTNRLGNISPGTAYTGNGSVNTLTLGSTAINTTLIFGNNSQYNANLGAATGATGASDLIAINGQIDLARTVTDVNGVVTSANDVLTILGTLDATAQAIYTLATFTGGYTNPSAANAFNTVNYLPAGTTTFTTLPAAYTLVYNPTSIQLVPTTLVPEPGLGVVLGSSTVALGGLARRRRPKAS